MAHRRQGKRPAPAKQKIEQKAPARDAAGVRANVPPNVCQRLTRVIALGQPHGLAQIAVRR
jgi:hypothetical protein